jgi:hypothetical protein
LRNSNYNYCNNNKLGYNSYRRDPLPKQATIANTQTEMKVANNKKYKKNYKQMNGIVVAMYFKWTIVKNAMFLQYL